MLVGVPKEIKANENRVAATPAGAHAFVQAGHEVLVETSAGVGSGFTDEEYVAAGARIAATNTEVFAAADMIVKVKEPLKSEYDLLRADQILFTYLHLAPEPELTAALMRNKVVSIAYETVQLPDGSLPLLTPMSEVAGRMATQIGAHLLEKYQGGRGVLLGGVPGYRRPTSASLVAVSWVLTPPRWRSAWAPTSSSSTSTPTGCATLMTSSAAGSTRLCPTRTASRSAAKADLLIGGPGRRCAGAAFGAGERGQDHEPGSVIVDVAIDQGGCIETIDRVTTHANPTYVKHGVIHYSVANMPGAVPRTSTLALTNATLPYALALANKGWRQAIADDPALALGMNVLAGSCCYQAVAEAHGLEYVPVEAACALR